MINFNTIKIYCSGCSSLLYEYHKAGSGLLVKCYKDRIKEDYTRGDLRCPKCGSEFARERMIHGKPAHKIIQGKVYVKT
jgi:DNA-directed RNA polymerase subunit M/transcription elongation factor TFIIS